MEKMLSDTCVKISPRALALAIQHNLNLHEINPTGPNGRIVETDVLGMLGANAETKTAFGDDGNKSIT